VRDTKTKRRRENSSNAKSEKEIPKNVEKKKVLAEESQRPLDVAKQMGRPLRAGGKRNASKSRNRVKKIYVCVLREERQNITWVGWLKRSLY